jgi:hypothetical protein
MGNSDLCGYVELSQVADRLTAAQIAQLPMPVADLVNAADVMRDGVLATCRRRGRRVWFGSTSAIEATHKLAQHIMDLPPHQRDEVLAWIGNRATR